MKTYCFLLNFGYAEDGSLGYVPFASTKKFASTKAAFTDLAEFFKDAFMGEKTEPKKCCLASKVKAGPSDHSFCPKCGSFLNEREFDVYQYIYFVKDIGGASNDSYHTDIAEYDDQARWQPIPMEDALLDLKGMKIINVAEKCLAAALGHSPDDRVDIDRIFKDHRKTNSFSFWN